MAHRSERRRLSAIVAAALLMTSVFGGGALATPTSAASDGNVQDSTEDGVDPALTDAEGETELIVRFADSSAAGTGETLSARTLKQRASADQRSFEELAAATDAIEIERQFWIANAALVTVDTDEMSLDRLLTIEGVDRLHSNFEIEAPSPEPAAGTAETGNVTYGLEQIRAPEVWEEYDTRGEGVTVAVLDTGVDPSHPDIDLPEGNWAEFDRQGERIDSEPYDNIGHGTHVSGTVVGGDASGQHIGVAPNATLMHGGVLTGNGGTFSTYAAAMEWAVENDADVVSMSLGHTGYHDELIEPVRKTEAAGTAVVVAIGNEFEGSSRTPGNVYDSFSIGATDRYENVAPFSSGEVVRTDEAWSDPPDEWPDEYVVPDVAAPGVHVRSAMPGGGYAKQNGTSMATPHVSGAMALVLSKNPDLSPEELEQLFVETVSSPPDAPDEKDTRYGHGIVDAYRAMEVATVDTTVTGTVTDESGDPLEGVTVESRYGHSTTTDADGSYTLRVPSEEQPLTAVGFGVVENETTIDTTDVDELSVDFVVETVPRVEIDSEVPARVEPGAEFDVELRLAQVETATVTADGSVSNATLVGPAEFGEPIDVSDVDRNGTASVAVATDPDEIGSLALTFAFETTTNESLEVTTSTTVRPEPLPVGEDERVETIQDALDLVEPGATIELVDETYEVRPNEEPIVATTPVTLTGADGVDPVIDVAGDANETDAGIAVEADDTTVSDLAVTGTNLTDGIAVADGASSVRANGTDVRGAANGISIGEESSASVVDNRITDIEANGVAVDGTASSVAENVVTDSNTAIAISGDAPLVENNTVTDVETGIRVGGTADSVVQNHIESNETGLEIVDDGIAFSVLRNEIDANGTGTVVDQYATAVLVEENRFAGRTGLDAGGYVLLPIRNDFSAVDGTAISTSSEVSAPYNYYGERGPEPGALEGPVVSDPFLTAPPDEVAEELAAVQRFGYHLEIEANETVAVSFPGPMENDLETTFGSFDGSLYAFDSERAEWRPVHDGNESPDALDAYVVSPEENVTVLVEFEASDEPGAPSEADVDSGWNLVGAPMVGDAEEAYAATSAEPARLLNPLPAPNGELVESDDDWLLYTFGSGTNEPSVTAHQGYFLYANRDGGIGTNVYPGITVGEVEELLGFSRSSSVATLADIERADADLVEQDGNRSTSNASA